MWERNCSLCVSGETVSGFLHTQTIIALLLGDLLRLPLHRAPPFIFSFSILIANRVCQYHTQALSATADCSKDTTEAISKALVHSHRTAFASRVADTVPGTGNTKVGRELPALVVLTFQWLTTFLMMWSPAICSPSSPDPLFSPQPHRTSGSVLNTPC